MPREVLLEHIEWNRDKLLGSAVKLVNFYAQSFSFLGLEHWYDFCVKGVGPTIENLLPGSVEFNAPFFDLIFHGPQCQTIQVIEDGCLVFKQIKPKFIFRDRSYQELNARQRMRLFSINHQIGEEMAEVYKMRVKVGSPFIFEFLPRYYADSFEISKGYLL